MNFKEVIVLSDWDDIKEKMLLLYSDLEGNLEGYESVYEKLLTIEPTESDRTLTLSTVPPSKFNDEEYITVSGEGISKEDDEDTGETKGDLISYGISFNPWDEWLAMQIHENTLRDFSYTEIVAYSLWEMTFAGFDEEEIQAESDKIIGKVKDIKSGKGKLSKAVDFEEMMRMLEDENNGD